MSLLGPSSSLVTEIGEGETEDAVETVDSVDNLNLETEDGFDDDSQSLKTPMLRDIRKNSYRNQSAVHFNGFDYDDEGNSPRLSFLGTKPSRRMESLPRTLCQPCDSEEGHLSNGAPRFQSTPASLEARRQGIVQQEEARGSSSETSPNAFDRLSGNVPQKRNLSLWRQHHDTDESHHAALGVLLAYAVESLPAYIELSWLMLVLAPLGEHQDREGEVVDWSSWRQRGWCRLEMLAAKLSRNDTQVVVVHGREKKLEFMTSLDKALLPPGLGNFSCCAVGHDFGNGKMPCDRVVVHSVLTRMIQAKIEDLWNKGKWMEMRNTAAMQHWYSQGLDVGRKGRPMGSFMSIAKRTFMGYGAKDEGRSEAFKAVLHWRDDEIERQQTKLTGASFLTWAVIANDLPCVRDVLKDHRLSRRSAQKERDINTPIAKDLPQLPLMKGTTPLMLAMAMSRWEIVELLLDEGAEGWHITDRMGLDCVMLAAMYGNSDNVKGWLRRYPAWELERREKLCGFTALGMAVFMGCSNKLETVHALLDGGADPMALNCGVGVSLLHIAAINPDTSPELLQNLLDYKGGLLKPMLHVRNYPRSAEWRVRYWTARALARVGSNSKMATELAWYEGATPVQMAAGKGHLVTTRLLRDAAIAPLASKNSQGRNAAELVYALHNGGPPPMLEDCVGALPNAKSIMGKRPAQIKRKNSIYLIPTTSHGRSQPAPSS
jgi:ankyrin repeat protein